MIIIIIMINNDNSKVIRLVNDVVIAEVDEFKFEHEHHEFLRLLDVWRSSHVERVAIRRRKLCQLTLTTLPKYTDFPQIKC